MNALIIGANGQDGNLLTQSLMRDGYAVTGVSRSKVLSYGTGLHLNPIDITNQAEVDSLIAQACPNEVYFLAAYHHSSQSEMPPPGELFNYSMKVHVIGLVCFLDAIKRLVPKTRLFYAASSLIFGNVPHSIANEETPRTPRCAYGISKAAGMDACAAWRERYGVYASCGILFNHESSLRPTNFLSQKVATAVAEILAGKRQKLVLGDLRSGADFGYAPDYVEGMRAILGLPTPQDYVLATGTVHTTRDWLEEAFGYVGLRWEDYVQIEPNILSRHRQPLAGDSKRLTAATGWKPVTSFSSIVREMVKSACERADRKKKDDCCL